jgi:serine/threonine protein kinase
MGSTTLRPLRLPVTNRYEFQKPLGSGGVGTVYRALDRRTGELVAVKVLNIRASQNPTVHKRLEREFHAATELEHPNIVRALAFETDGEISFLVYELVNGCSLGARVEEHGRLPEGEVVRLITQVAQALHYAHSRGVVHRDVKPDNILLLPDGRAKLTDFGLAKTLDANEELTRNATGLGTPHFMAPEQFADAKSAGPRADVYSLGATLYNLVTGRLPFDAKTDLAILAKKERGLSHSPKSLVPGLSDRVDAAILAAVNPNPANRPGSCLEFFKLLTARAPKKHSPSRLTAPKLTKPAGPADRRAWVRFPLGAGGCGYVDTTLHGAAAETEEGWPLVVRDVSVGGIGIVLARRFERGTELSVEMRCGPDQATRRFRARVIRVDPDRGGHWVHGCAFLTPLGETDLVGLLQFA